MRIEAVWDEIKQELICPVCKSTLDEDDSCECGGCDW